MVTITKRSVVNPLTGYSKRKYVDIYSVMCKSTDIKPKVTNGSVCIEIDTGKKFLFDEEYMEWNEVDSSIIVGVEGVIF